MPGSQLAFQHLGSVRLEQVRQGSLRCQQAAVELFLLEAQHQFLERRVLVPRRLHLYWFLVVVRQYWQVGWACLLEELACSLEELACSLRALEYWLEELEYSLAGQEYLPVVLECLRAVLGY